MSTSLEGDGMRIRVELVPNFSQNDFVVWSYYTGKRDESEFAQLATVVDAHVGRVVGSSDLGVVADFIEGRVYFDYWADPIFSSNGWGAAGSAPLTRPIPAANPLLPPQVAVVVSRETNDSELPARRRRNRSYWGPITPSSLDDDGRLVAGLSAQIVTEMQTFDTSLGSAPLASGVPVEYDGLCNVSYLGTSFPSGPQIAKTDQVRVGDVLDTQRSRRNGLTETYSLGPV